MLRECEVYLPTAPVEYGVGWQWQKQLLQARLRDPSLPDVLILLEHPPVYTLGQGSSLQFLKFDPACPPYPLYRTERGGEVTYHGIGQLVGYPILNLRHYQLDLHWYLRQLEALMIDTLAHYGIAGQRKSGLTGVWVGDRKIAQIGIKVSRWVTMHGFALNVNMDMQGFSKIVPCGLRNYDCTQLAEYLPGIQVQDLIPIVLAKFSAIFATTLRLQPNPQLIL
ncbi:MAG: lipoyl(octanoyl) transferase LipB [Pseudanabaenaceae cyanobacterium]